MDKDILIDALVKYFEKKVQNKEIGLSDLEKVKQYSKDLICLIKKAENDKLTRSDIPYDESCKIFDRLFKIHQPTTRFFKTLTNYVINTEGIPTALHDVKGNKYEFEADEVAMNILWTYTTHCELMLILIKNFFDMRLINSFLSTPPIKIQTFPDDEHLTLNPVIKILKAYSNTTLFNDIDVDLRNKISHYDFYFKEIDNKLYIFYGNNKKELSDLIATAKNANFLFAVMIIAIGLIKNIQPPKIY